MGHHGSRLMCFGPFQFQGTVDTITSSPKGGEALITSRNVQGPSEGLQISRIELQDVALGHPA